MINVNSSMDNDQLQSLNPSFKAALRRRQSGSVLNLVLIGVLGALVLAIGLYYFTAGSGQSSLEQPLTAIAFTGSFSKEVLDQGEIQSSENVEIRCDVKSRYGSRGVTIKDMVEEGTMVSEGDFLIELRSDEIQAGFETQEIALANANDAVKAATNNLAAANAAHKEYVEGTYKESRSEILNKISEAEEAFETAKEFVKFSKKLQAKSFITRIQLRSDEAARDRAKRSLEAAKESLFVLDTYSKEKNEKELDAKKNIAQSKLDAALAAQKIESATYAEIKAQLAACIIVVPEGQQGQVVYANVFSRRGSAEFVLEEGASVREGQVLIRLPNPRKMQVRATVNESRVTSIKQEMPVVIAVDALNGKTLAGKVTRVNQYAEPDGWGSGGVRKFAVYIEIENPTPEIRPGMNASVTVETERLNDALMIPIQSVYGYRGKTFCLIKSNTSDWETVEVEVGSNNDTNVVVLSGLSEGDEVALNPAGFKDLMDLPELPVSDASQDGKSSTAGNRAVKGRSKESSTKPKAKKANKKGRVEKKSGADETTFNKSGKDTPASLKTNSDSARAQKREADTGSDSA
jgi:multidrug resistance efflux pump